MNYGNRSNTGNSALTVSNISYPAGLSGAWPAGTIPTMGSRNVALTFSPSALISYGGSVTVHADHTAGTNTITVLGTGISATPIQLSAVALSNGMFRFSLSGPVSSNCVIQVSSNLVNWLSLVTNVIPAGGSVPITDPITGAGRRFYRAVGF